MELPSLPPPKLHHCLMRRSVMFWVEVVSLLPCSLILGKFLLVGLVWMMFLLAASAFGSAHPVGGWREGLVGTALFLLLMVGGLAGLWGMWAGVLLGAERVRQRAWLRWAVLASLFLGLGAAGYWLAYTTILAPGATSGPWGWAFWSLPLVPAIVVSVRYACLLLRSIGGSERPG